MGYPSSGYSVTVEGDSQDSTVVEEGLSEQTGDSKGKGKRPVYDESKRRRR